jgi:hypothetical protein
VRKDILGWGGGSKGEDELRGWVSGNGYGDIGLRQGEGANGVCVCVCKNGLERG